VIEHVRLRVEDRVERIFVAIEIRNQYFQLAAGIQGPHLPNRFSPMRGAAIGQIVAIY
jgi:hypothetical protein